ncbi:universal stress protein [Clostridium magnum]|uniref:Sensor protein KdpD n=1 Tax=Clostridium magnum DSM 2767 TaxID=1121326 RepID=A0A161XCC8_9CLOT|nr:universal stress protein [Clostridium magnum]KZL91956.1 sensor protein KdpD [Clostridium magnum DSM 2767]SHH28465.1 two-component system, OmpR family, sensor histidine kinase KdpD [Clostridium magnum DSM 2767]
MNSDFKRTTPEEALKKLREELRGRLKIYIGYAPGVGKTYAMLNDANSRLENGEDIVIGYLESHQRKETENQIGKLETVPRKNVEYNDVAMEEMDTDAIISRKPNTVLIDELAHTNVPGSKNKKRYEDVEEVLSQGINVVSTLNIQHLESLNDIVRQITGVTVRETIPDKIIENADEVVVIDIAPIALQTRLKGGYVYKNENVGRALKNFFRLGNLNALREIALRQTAEEVDEDLEEYRKEHGIKEHWHVIERVMVCISPSPTSKKLIRRGARIAKKFKCEWIVVNVNSTRIFAQKMTEKDAATLEGHFKLAMQLGAEVVNLTGKSISRELTQFATQRYITQIIIGHSTRTKLQTLLRGSTVTRLLKLTRDIEVHVIPNDLK